MSGDEHPVAHSSLSPSLSECGHHVSSYELGRLHRLIEGHVAECDVAAHALLNR
jgi:hypothetical protein